VSTRSRMSHGGWEVWVYGGTVLLYYVEINTVRSMVSYYVCCRMICTYILILYIYTMCKYHTECGFYSRGFGVINLF
jgi:hypothetical protein